MNDLKELDEVQTAKNAYRLIIESGRSIEDISLYLKISERVIYYWRTGQRFPSIKHIYGLAQLFNLPIESILA